MLMSADLVQDIERAGEAMGRARVMIAKRIIGKAVDAARARADYDQYCAPCHGEDGGGKQGGDVEFAPSLKSREFQRAASDGFLLATIVRGRIGTKMAAFGEGAGPGVWLKPQEISDIVSFIRSWRTPIQAGGRGGADADTGRDMQR